LLVTHDPYRHRDAHCQGAQSDSHRERNTNAVEAAPHLRRGGLVSHI
jgi:hypothetical protein